MKKKSGRGFAGAALRRVAGWFTSNWGLKMLALLLAFAVYYTMKPSVGQRRDGKAGHDGNILGQQR